MEKKKERMTKGIGTLPVRLEMGDNRGVAPACFMCALNATERQLGRTEANSLPEQGPGSFWDGHWANWGKK